MIIDQQPETLATTLQPETDDNRRFLELLALVFLVGGRITVETEDGRKAVHAQLPSRTMNNV